MYEIGGIINSELYMKNDARVQSALNPAYELSAAPENFTSHLIQQNESLLGKINRNNTTHVTAGMEIAKLLAGELFKPIFKSFFLQEFNGSEGHDHIVDHCMDITFNSLSEQYLNKQSLSKFGMNVLND